MCPSPLPFSTPAFVSGPAPFPWAITPRIDRQVLRVAFAYDAIPLETLQRLRATLAGEHNIAQALETAREIVERLTREELAFVLARLLVCSADTLD